MHESAFNILIDLTILLFPFAFVAGFLLSRWILRFFFPGRTISPSSRSNAKRDAPSPPAAEQQTPPEAVNIWVRPAGVRIGRFNGRPILEAVEVRFDGQMCRMVYDHVVQGFRPGAEKRSLIVADGELQSMRTTSGVVYTRV